MWIIEQGLDLLQSLSNNYKGFSVKALPHEELRKVMRRYGRLGDY